MRGRSPNAKDLADVVELTRRLNLGGSFAAELPKE
jgi:hypothetical protein